MNYAIVKFQINNHMKRYIITIVILFVSMLAIADTSVSYTYDNMNRLKKVTYSNGVTVNYTYDALGNRTKKTVTGTGLLRGDVNSDGTVNINDVISLINYVLKEESNGINLSNSDCDYDGNVNINDLIVLINYVLHGSW